MSWWNLLSPSRTWRWTVVTRETWENHRDAFSDVTLVLVHYKEQKTWLVWAERAKRYCPSTRSLMMSPSASSFMLSVALSLQNLENSVTASVQCNNTGWWRKWELFFFQRRSWALCSMVITDQSRSVVTLVAGDFFLHFLCDWMMNNSPTTRSTGKLSSSEPSSYSFPLLPTLPPRKFSHDVFTW